MRNSGLGLVLLSLLAAGPAPVLKGCGGGGGMGRMEGGLGIDASAAPSVEVVRGMRHSQAAQQQFGSERRNTQGVEPA